MPSVVLRYILLQIEEDCTIHTHVKPEVMHFEEERLNNVSN